MSVSRASAVWQGGLKDGKGTITGASGAFSEMAYDFRKRFEGEPGTNPEELIAAAHASCFAMALSGEINKAGLSPERLDSRAEVTLDRTDKGPTVTKIKLFVEARVPGMNADAFLKAADTAKANCPISRLLGAAAEIGLDAKLL
jgi:osmotically inducible protein OsmC